MDDTKSKPGKRAKAQIAPIKYIFYIIRICFDLDMYIRKFSYWRKFFKTFLRGQIFHLVVSIQFRKVKGKITIFFKRLCSPKSGLIYLNFHLKKKIQKTINFNSPPKIQSEFECKTLRGVSLTKKGLINFIRKFKTNIKKYFFFPSL